MKPPPWPIRQRDVGEQHTITLRKPAEIYKRFNITQSVKDGWRVGDVSVSAKYEEGSELTPAEMQLIALETIEEAQGVCDTKNHERDQTNRFTSKG